MSRLVPLCLLMAAAALAAPHDDLECVRAVRIYYGTITGGGGIETARDIFVKHLKACSAKTRASCIRQLNRGFEKKYGKDTAYHRCLAESLAAGGKNGIATLYRRYKTEKKRREIRLVAAESLAKCGDPLALDTLVKICFDADPEVAAAAVTGVGAFPQTPEKQRKGIAKKLVALYSKITDGAAGKEADTAPMKLYRAIKDPMNATLGAFTGQTLNSAAAWKAWLSENITSTWPG